MVRGASWQRRPPRRRSWPRGPRAPERRTSRAALWLDIRGCSWPRPLIRTRSRCKATDLPAGAVSATVYSMQSASFERPNISEELANSIRQMIVDGAIPAGSRINEVHLARDLGVSRTPLREAIARLVREDTLVAVPRVGAFVKPLSVDEFDQIYSIRNLLDPEALRIAGMPSQQQL